MGNDDLNQDLFDTGSIADKIDQFADGLENFYDNRRDNRASSLNYDFSGTDNLPNSMHKNHGGHHYSQSGGYPGANSSNYGGYEHQSQSISSQIREVASNPYNSATQKVLSARQNATGSASAGETRTGSPNISGARISAGGNSLGSISSQQATIRHTQQAQGANTELGSFGAYNTRNRHAWDDIKYATAESTTNAVKSSDAYSGYSKIRHGAEFIGAGIAGSKIAKAQLYDRMQKVGTGIQVHDKNGNVITIAGQVQGDALRSYKNNMDSVDKYLNEHNINSKNLERFYDKRHIRKNTDGTFKIGGKVLTSEEKAVLDKKFELQKLDSLYKEAGKHSSLDVAKTWTKESLGNSDAAKGYDVYRVAKGSAKVAIATGKGLVAATPALVAGAAMAPRVALGAAQAGAKVTAKGAKVTSKALSKVSKGSVRMTEASKKLAKVSTNLTNKAGNIKTVNAKIKHFQAKRMDRASTIAKFSPKTAVKNAIAKSAPAQAFRRFQAEIYDRIRQSLIGRIGGAMFKPFKLLSQAFSSLKAAIKRLIIAVGLIMLVFLILWMIICAACGAFTSNSTSDSDLDIAACMQDAIDFIYEKQMAFELNEWDYNDDNEGAHHGVPSTWDLTDREVTDGTVFTDSVLQLGESYRNYDIRDDDRIRQDRFGKLRGYVLSNYWGKEMFLYFADVPLFEQYIISGPDEEGNYEYGIRETGETKRISFIAGAGVNGYINDGAPIDIDMYDQYVLPKTDSAYRNRDLLYNDIEKEYTYIGSDIVEFNNYNAEYPGADHESSVYHFGYVHPERGFTTESIEASDGVYKQRDEGLVSGNTYDYSINSYYRSLVILPYSVAENLDDLNCMTPKSVEKFFRTYADNIFTAATETAEVELDVEYAIDSSLSLKANIEFSFPDAGSQSYEVEFDVVRPTLKLFTTYKNSGLLDMASLDDNDDLINNYISKIQRHIPDFTWNGWWDPSTGYMTENYRFAVDSYGFKEDTFTAFYEGVVLPSQRAQQFSRAEIDALINEIILWNGALTEEQQAAIEYAMSLIGKYTYKYSYWGQDGLHSDCSGFISRVMQDTGVSSWPGGRRGCTGFLSLYGGARWNGDYSTLAPGSLIIKNGEIGGAKSSNNHIVMYCGMGEDGPIIVECTSARNPMTDKDGTQQASQRRASYIAQNYAYVIEAERIYR